MEKFLINEFFDLSHFAHRSLFEKGRFGWDALNYLKDFLAKAHLGKIECPVPSGAILENSELIAIGKGTIIEPGAYIKGPCLIGRDCEIRHGAYLRGFVVTGDRCVLGHSSEVKESILLDEASAPHFNYVGNSILGNRVNLGAGAVLANTRLDRRVIQIRYLETVVSTGLYKLGAILGDGAQIGCNAVINPGSLIGKEAFCHPSITTGGYIPPFTKVKFTGKNICQ